MVDFYRFSLEPLLPVKVSPFCVRCNEQSHHKQNNHSSATKQTTNTTRTHDTAIFTRFTINNDSYVLGAMGNTHTAQYTIKCRLQRRPPALDLPINYVETCAPALTSLALPCFTINDCFLCFAEHDYKMKRMMTRIQT